MHLGHQVASHTIAFSMLAAPSQLKEITHQSDQSTNKHYGQVALVRVELVHEIFLRSVESMNNMQSFTWRPAIKHHLDNNAFPIQVTHCLR